jgi:MoaA/NifB/PqqE/SkfB family radical SAM enzyme
MKPMKAYTNLIKSRINKGLRRDVINNYPAYAVIDPTSFCQLRCPACPTGLRSGVRASASMSWERYKSVIDEVGDYLFRLDLYNWGEPLLHREAPEFIQYAVSKGIRVKVDSNLSMKLSDDYIARLVRSGLQSLVVSLDGATQDTYSKYRRGGDILLVRENMLRIQKAKSDLGLPTPKVFWKFLVFQHNEHEVDMARSSYGDWGADELLVSGAFMPKVEPYDREFQPSAQFTCCLVPNGTGRQWSARTCSWLYQGLALNANGKVSPCCAIEVEEDDFGEHSVEDGFLRIWNNSRFVKARRFCANPSKIRESRRAAGETRSTCEKCPAGWVDSVARMPEGQINAALMDEAESLLRGKRDAEFLLRILLVAMAGGEPVQRYLRARVTNRVKRLRRKSPAAS